MPVLKAIYIGGVQQRLKAAESIRFYKNCGTTNTLLYPHIQLDFDEVNDSGIPMETIDAERRMIDDLCLREDVRHLYLVFANVVNKDIDNKTQHIVNRFFGWKAYITYRTPSARRRAVAVQTDTVAQPDVDQIPFRQPSFMCAADGTDWRDRVFKRVMIDEQAVNKGESEKLIPSPH